MSSEIDISDARFELVDALNELPQSDAVGWDTANADVTTLGEVDFLVTIKDWVTEYRKVVGTIQTTAANMSAELRELRDQKRAIRAFLGTTTTGDE